MAGGSSRAEGGVWGGGKEASFAPILFGERERGTAPVTESGRPPLPLPAGLLDPGRMRENGGGGLSPGPKGHPQAAVLA